MANSSSISVLFQDEMMYVNLQAACGHDLNPYSIMWLIYICSLHLSGRMKRKITSYFSKKPSKETRDSDVARQDESQRLRVRERDTEREVQPESESESDFLISQGNKPTGTTHSDCKPSMCAEFCLPQTICVI